MADYVILADSCMDLSKEQREQYGIEKPIPGSIVYPERCCGNPVLPQGFGFHRRYARWDNGWPQE